MTTIPPETKWRQIEHIQPGHWVLIEYEHNETKRTHHVWSQVVMSLSLTQIETGRKIEELRGNDANGYGWDFRQFRGFQMQSLTEAQGKKAGLTIPSEPGPEEPA